MSWVQALLEWLRNFWPFVIVMQYERGIRYWRGRVVDGALEPDWYWCVPFFMEIHTVQIMPDILKMYNLNITTTDDVSLRFRANIRYDIFDAIKVWNEVQDYKDNLGDECRTNLASAMRNLSYAELLTGQGAIEKEAKSAINKVVKEWGIRIIRVSVTDFIKTTDISLAQV